MQETVPEIERRYLDLSAALTYLGWGEKGRAKLYALTSQREIPAYKHGNRLFFLPNELNEYMNKFKVGARREPSPTFPPPDERAA